MSNYLKDNLNYDHVEHFKPFLSQFWNTVNAHVKFVIFVVKTEFCMKNFVPLYHTLLDAPLNYLEKQEENMAVMILITLVITSSVSFSWLMISAIFGLLCLSIAMQLSAISVHTLTCLQYASSGLESRHVSSILPLHFCCTYVNETWIWKDFTLHMKL